LVWVKGDGADFSLFFPRFPMGDAWFEYRGVTDPRLGRLPAWLRRLGLAG
jgi:hypothetical protein